MPPGLLGVPGAAPAPGGGVDTPPAPRDTEGDASPAAGEEGDSVIPLDYHLTPGQRVLWRISPCGGYGRERWIAVTVYAVNGDRVTLWLSHRGKPTPATLRRTNRAQLRLISLPPGSSLEFEV